MNRIPVPGEHIKRQPKQKKNTARNNKKRNLCSEEDYKYSCRIKQKNLGIGVCRLQDFLLNNYQLNISIAFIISADVEGFSLISFISDKKSLWKEQLASL